MITNRDKKTKRPEGKRDTPHGRRVCLGVWRGLAVGLAVAGLALGGWPVGAQPASFTQGISSLSAILYEPTTGLVLYEKDAYTPRPMASTTKLMTALVAAEMAQPEQDVVVTEEAVRVEGSALGLRAGDHISMKDLLTGLLLASGNDAANTVALTLCGSLPAFADRMNQKARELGMGNSTFVTPSGLDQGEHSSSAADMAKLAAAVLQQPMLAEICAMKTAVIEMGDPKRKVTVSNHNKLLSLYQYATGMKTGFTKKSGKCLVSSAEKDGVSLVVVTLNGGDYWNDHIKLYEYGFSQLERVAFDTPELAPLPIGGGQTGQVSIETEAPPDRVMRIGERDRITVQVELPRFSVAPISAGQVVGTVRYFLNGKELAACPIRAGYTVEERPVSPPITRWRRWLGRLWDGLLVG